MTASIHESEQAERAYYRWRYYYQEVDDPRVVWAFGWLEGGRAALRASSEFVELVPLLRQLIAWLESEED